MCKRAGLLTPGNEVDHIVPKAQGGTDDLSNLAVICRRHHQAKTQAESNGKDYAQKGCGIDGNPVDPGHHWNAQG